MGYSKIEWKKLAKKTITILVSNQVLDWQRNALRVSISVVFFGLLSATISLSPASLETNFRQACNWAAITCIVVTAPLTGKVAQVTFDRFAGTSLACGLGIGIFIFAFNVIGGTWGNVFVALMAAPLMTASAYVVGQNKQLEQFGRFFNLTYCIVALAARPGKNATVLSLMRTGGVFAGGFMSMLMAMFVLPKSGSVEAIREVKKMMKAVHDLNLKVWEITGIPNTGKELDDKYSRKNTSFDHPKPVLNPATITSQALAVGQPLLESIDEGPGAMDPAALAWHRTQTRTAMLRARAAAATASAIAAAVARGQPLLESNDDREKDDPAALARTNPPQGAGGDVGADVSVSGGRIRGAPVTAATTATTTTLAATAEVDDAEVSPSGARADGSALEGAPRPQQHSLPPGVASSASARHGSFAFADGFAAAGVTVGSTENGSMTSGALSPTLTAASGAAGGGGMVRIVVEDPAPQELEAHAKSQLESCPEGQQDRLQEETEEEEAERVKAEEAEAAKAEAEAEAEEEKREARIKAVESLFASMHGILNKIDDNITQSNSEIYVWHFWGNYYFLPGLPWIYNPSRWKVPVKEIKQLTTCLRHVANMLWTLRLEFEDFGPELYEVLGPEAYPRKLLRKLASSQCKAMKDMVDAFASKSSIEIDHLLVLGQLTDGMLKQTSDAINANAAVAAAINSTLNTPKGGLAGGAGTGPVPPTPGGMQAAALMPAAMRGGSRMQFISPVDRPLSSIAMTSSAARLKMMQQLAEEGQEVRAKPDESKGKYDMFKAEPKKGKERRGSKAGGDPPPPPPPSVVPAAADAAAAKVGDVGGGGGGKKPSGSKGGSDGSIVFTSRLLAPKAGDKVTLTLPPKRRRGSKTYREQKAAQAKGGAAAPAGAAGKPGGMMPAASFRTQVVTPAMLMTAFSQTIGMQENNSMYSMYAALATIGAAGVPTAASPYPTSAMTAAAGNTNAAAAAVNANAAAAAATATAAAAAAGGTGTTLPLGTSPFQAHVPQDMPSGNSPFGQAHASRPGGSDGKPAVRLTGTEVPNLQFPPTEQGYMAQVRWYSFQFIMNVIVNELENAFVACSNVMKKLPYPLEV